jgi:hypothetical protein
MSHHVPQGFKKLFLLYLSVICILFISHSAFATNQNVPAGCDPKVMDAAGKKGAAQAAARQAVVEQLLKKPRSVLELSCFNQMASVAAKKACKIFSGDCTDDVEGLIKDPLRAWYKNFDEKAEDKGSEVNLTADKYDCDKIRKAWEAEEKAGTDKSVPTMIGDEQLMKNDPPKCDDVSGNEIDCGDDFIASWKASAEQKIFSDYADSVGKLTKSSTPSGAGCNGNDGSAAVIKCNQ